MRIFLNNPLYMLCLLMLFALVIPTKNLAADTENDPFEKTNRAIFEFNNTLDDNFLNLLQKHGEKFQIFPENH